jgi:[acyl-carrier-protein] S-malonyltransferase
MGKELYDNSRTIQEYFEEASNCLGTNFIKLCFASSDAELTKVAHAYPALFLTEVAIAHMIQEVCPTLAISAVAGRGVGEFSALYTARGITFPDGLYLLSKFSRFYSDVQDTLNMRTVVIAGLTDKQLKPLCEDVEVTVYEHDRYLVSGGLEAIDAFVERARDAGCRRVKNVDAVEGYHMPVLKDIMEQLMVYLTKVDFNDPEIPLITGIDGKQVTSAKKAQEVLMRQIVEPLNWKSVLKQFADYDMLLIPGPSKALASELALIFPNKTILGIETMADIEMLQSLVNGVEAETVVRTA